jgi:hypothetical protein
MVPGPAWGAAAWHGVVSGREEIKLAVEGDGGPGRAAFTCGAANFWAANSQSAKGKKKHHAWGAVSGRSDWPGLALTFRRPPLDWRERSAGSRARRLSVYPPP